MNSFELYLPGKPTGKARPRFARGRTFTDPQTEAAEARVQRAWEQAGAPRLDGALYVRVFVGTPRPKSHYKRDGNLNTEGLRHPFPTSRPDLDNVVKLVTDALNGLAFHDDAQIVTVLADRCWTDQAHTLIRVTALTADDAIGWEPAPTSHDDPDLERAA